MRAAIINQFGGPEVIEIADIEKPEPKGKEVLVKNVAKCLQQSERRPIDRKHLYVFLLMKFNI